MLKSEKQKEEEKRGEKKCGDAWGTLKKSKQTNRKRKRVKEVNWKKKNKYRVKKKKKELRRKSRSKVCVIFVRFRCAFVIRKKEKKGVQKKKR